MRGRRCALIARLGLGGQRVRVDPQHRVAGLGRPRRGGHRVLGRGRTSATTTRAARLAGGGGLQAVDRRGERGRVGARDVGGLRSPRACARLADPDHLRAAGLRRAGRAERVERGLRRVGQVRRRRRTGSARAAGGSSAGRRRSRRCQSFASTSIDRRRAGVARARGVDRLRDAGGVGDRVGRRPRASCSWWRRRGSRGPAAACSSSPLLPTTGWRCVAGALAAPAAAGSAMRRARARGSAAGGTRPGTR